MSIFPVLSLTCDVPSSDLHIYSPVFTSYVECMGKPENRSVAAIMMIDKDSYMYGDYIVDRSNPLASVWGDWKMRR